MAAMILVENPGNWSIYKPLRHARWGMVGDDGLPVHENITPTDLIMPFFLFIVGVSIVFAHPAGIVSTFPAIVTGLIGVLTGILLKTEKDQNRIVGKLLMWGVILLVVGFGWSLFFPIIKDLWTSSYTLVAGGYGLIVFAFVYWLVDIKKSKSWTEPFVIQLVLHP